MEKINVALFGGGFNPIANHHQLMAQEIWKKTGMNTWLMPCYDHLFAKNSLLIDSYHRWNMVTEVSHDFSYMTACSWEIDRHHNGTMFDTLSGLTGTYTHLNFHIVIGMDNANIIRTKWKMGQYLIETYPFIVMGTKDQQEDDWFLQEPHRFIPFDYPVHSSAIRKAIEDGDHDFAKKHTHPSVWGYITSGRLYEYEELENAGT